MKVARQGDLSFKMNEELKMKVKPGGKSQDDLSCKHKRIHIPCGCPECYPLVGICQSCSKVLAKYPGEEWRATNEIIRAEYPKIFERNLYRFG